MELREIRQNGEICEYADAIWKAESVSSSRWFADAIKAWQSTPAEQTEFIENCQEIFGLFDDTGKFCGCIYFERQIEPKVLNVHISIIAKIDLESFLSKLIEIRDRLFHSGIVSIRGWMVKRNRGLLNILKKVGFREVGFYMDHGISHGRLLRWTMIEVAVKND